MSYSVDANVLLYASDASNAHHVKASTFLAGCARNPDLFCLGWPTLMGYLRIATHPAIFASPLTPDEALRNIDALLALPQVRLLSEGDRFRAAYSEVTAGQAVRGNLVPDAHLAALLSSNGVETLYTADADFRRFPSLKVVNPFKGS